MIVRWRPAGLGTLAVVRVIRHARRDDWLAAARINVRGWQHAYRGAMDDEFLASMVPEEWSEWRSHRYGNPLPGVAHLVEIVAGTLVGYCDVGPARSEDDSVSGELYAIYVEPDLIGCGHGRPLIAAARAVLATMGHGQAELWVLAGNERARRFYEADGWRHDGRTKTEDFGGSEILEVRYVRDLQ